MFLAKVREKYDPERLRGIHSRLWHWTRVSIVVTGVLFAAAWFCDHFTLSAPRSMFIFFGSFSLCATLALVILVSLVEGVAAIVDPKRGRPLEILALWLFNAFLIALLGLMGVAILAALSANR